MLITVADLRRDPVEFHETIPAGVIDFGQEVRQREPLSADGRADLIEEHRGPHEVVPDIRLRAAYKGRFEVPCARCVEPVDHAISGDFDLLFRPLGVDAGAAERAISTSETEIGYYGGESLVLEDVLREQVLLSLPAKTLCRPDCKGLCPRCGHDLNAETCTCEETASDPRWNALSGLRSRIKQ